MTENMVCEFAPTTEEFGKPIYAINKESVHKICSGQVVLSLAIAVKELVENSIDAGASIIEVKLKEQGIEQIEVSDNGSGVEDCNFVGLTAKYHTSKIREFTDLASVETFGFRGEALSSLCALSDMSIITRHRSNDYGWKLVFDTNGEIISKSKCPREIGTTIIINNLFSKLPVRKKEFQKNIKREFSRMCNVLQGYCLMASGVRIVCSNQSRKGGRNTIISTNGSVNVLDNITTIFGAKQSNELLEIKPIVSKGNIAEKFSLEDFNETNTNISLTQEDIDSLNLARFSIEGWISSCAHGSGRSSRDRQYFFVNNRPCEPKNTIKLVNEIYHRYNGSQYPFVYLNIKLDRIDVDVNLTPDKRQVMINNEKILLLALKKSLLKTFADIPATLKFQNIQQFCVTDATQINKSDNFDNSDVLPRPNRQKFSNILSQWKMTGNTNFNTEQKLAIKPVKRKADEIESRNIKMKKIQNYLFSQAVDQDEVVSEEELENINYTSEHNFYAEENISKIKSEGESPVKQSKSKLILDGFAHTSETIKHQSNIDKEAEFLETPFPCKTNEILENTTLILDDINIPLMTDCNLDSDCEYENTTYLEIRRNSTGLKTSISEICDLLKLEEKAARLIKQTRTIDHHKFKFEINPLNNKNAELELETEISRDMFNKMTIVGQFNLGFIITKYEEDLFIIDQHASDEKYNFETLQKSIKLQNQKMMVPQNLDLTAINELVVIDNLNVFKMNGFEFLIDENQEPTKKVKLIGKPHSQNWEFGKPDIDELIFMLQDAPANSICRPSRIMKMFASRACRKSVMIGTALNKKEMKSLVEHMGNIEHPWNCPHGRPTMRHLINLSLLDSND